MPELNPEQRTAVEHKAGPLLIVAGPGAGKTRVITERIVWLLGQGRGAGVEPPLAPENILALTFTDKAAGEMKSRVSKALPQLETLPTVSTFHAFCYQALRVRHADRRLLDKVDVWIFLRRRIAELGLEFYRKLAEPGAFLHDLNDFFARCQDELIDPADFDLYVRQCEREAAQKLTSAAAATARSASVGASPGATSGKPSAAGAATARSSCAGPLTPAEVLASDELLKQKELAHVFRFSRQMLEESGSSSLGSLVSETVGLWRADAEALARTRAQFRAVLVDELQDTNYAQMELLKLLVPPPYSITAVGDDDQAIYRFRGASHGAFEMFGRAFPGHRVVYLARNYRSTRRILRAAASVIAHNDRYREKPELVSSGGEGCPVYVLKAANPADEAAWIGAEIERLSRGGTPLRDIAVLYRAHSYREPLVVELRGRNIPASIRGLSVLSTPILRDLVAYLRVIQSPHENIALTRLLAGARWRLPRSLAQVIREQAAACHGSIYDALIGGAHSQDLARTAWGELHDLLTSFRRLARYLPLTPLLDRLTERLGWRFAAGHQNQRNLDAFGKFIEAWEGKSETRKLAEFVEYLDYFIEAGGKVEAPEARSDAVQMMTVHAAKGLEFAVVFVLGVSSRRFPATERKPVIEFPPALRKGPPPPRDIHLQEERRLFFVALTRAKGRLYVSSVSKSERQQSAFIRELTGDPALRARDVELIEVPPGPEAAAGGGPQKLVLPASPRVKPERAERQNWLFEAGPATEPEIGLPAGAWTELVPAAPQLRLSATAAEHYLACPLKYKFQHVLTIPTGPQAALTFGGLMHRCVRQYFDLRRERQSQRGPQLAPISFEEIERFYLDQWRSSGFDDEYDEDTYRKAGLEQLRAFVDKQNALAFDPEAITMEQSFQVILDDVSLEGRIDQMNVLGAPSAREVELVDYKTGRARTEKDAEKSLQLSIYALAAERAFGLNASRLTFYNLSTNDAVSTARTSGDLGQAAEKIAEVAVGIRGGRFDAAPGFGCRWCDYVTLCPAHEG
ncbi:MAG: ATP-dependent helicase [Terriglobia bacterium]